MTPTGDGRRSATRTTLALVIAGALGVLTRHALQSSIGVHGRFPWATFVVNLSGAFAAGLLFTLIARRFSVPMWAQSAIFVGFLGGYTTFSALSLDTLLLLERDHWVLAGAYAMGSLAGGMVATFVGVRLGRAIP
jgi:fluoride exporter